MWRLSVVLGGQKLDTNESKRMKTESLATTFKFYYTREQRNGAAASGGNRLREDF